MFKKENEFTSAFLKVWRNWSSRLLTCLLGEGEMLEWKFSSLRFLKKILIKHNGRMELNSSVLTAGAWNSSIWNLLTFVKKRLDTWSQLKVSGNRTADYFEGWWWWLKQLISKKKLSLPPNQCHFICHVMMIMINACTYSLDEKIVYCPIFSYSFQVFLFEWTNTNMRSGCRMIFFKVFL